MTSEWLVVVGERDEMELVNGQRYPDTFEHPTVWDGVKDGKSEQGANRGDFPKPPNANMELGGFQELLNSKLIFQVVMKIYLSR